MHIIASIDGRHNFLVVACEFIAWLTMAVIAAGNHTTHKYNNRNGHNVEAKELHPVWSLRGPRIRRFFIFIEETQVDKQWHATKQMCTLLKPKTWSWVESIFFGELFMKWMLLLPKQQESWRVFVSIMVLCLQFCLQVQTTKSAAQISVQRHESMKLCRRPTLSCNFLFGHGQTIQTW